MLMWTDGEVFRSYGAQKADLKGYDGTILRATNISLPCRLLRVLHPQLGSRTQGAKGKEIRGAGKSWPWTSRPYL